MHTLFRGLRAARDGEQKFLGCVARLRTWRQRAQYRLLIMEAAAGELRGIIEHQRHVVLGAHRERLAGLNVHKKFAAVAGIDGVGKPAEPAVGVAAVGRAGVPVGHRGEMRKGRMLVADPLDDGHVTILVEALEPGHPRPESRNDRRSSAGSWPAIQACGRAR